MNTGWLLIPIFISLLSIIINIYTIRKFRTDHVPEDLVPEDDVYARSVGALQGKI